MRTERLIAAVAFAATGLAACSPREEPAPEVAALDVQPAVAGRAAAYQAAAVGPEAFVRALYARYAGPAEPAPPAGRDPLYSRTLNAMYGAAADRPPGRAPHLDLDPVCGCDAGVVSLTGVEVRQADINHSEADVTFTLDGQAQAQTLKLVREGPNWKVADVLIAGESPLTEQLLKVIS